MQSSLCNFFSCYETQQLILGTGTAIWWVTASLLEYQNYILLKHIWWSNFLYIFKYCSFFQHQCYLDICGSLMQLFSCIGVYYMVFYCVV